MLSGARAARAYEELEVELDTFRQLRVDAETIVTALTSRPDLAADSQQRVPIPDPLIAACAHERQAAVLRVDRDYETLARVLVFTRVRLFSRDRAQRRGAVPRCVCWQRGRNGAICLSPAVQHATRTSPIELSLLVVSVRSQWLTSCNRRRFGLSARPMSGSNRGAVARVAPDRGVGSW